MKDQKVHQTTGVMKMLLRLTDPKAFCVKKKNIKEALQCPADIKRSDIVSGAGYHTLTANLLRFQQLNILPAEIDLSLFDEGFGIANTLLKQRGKWHKSCRNRYANMLKPLVLSFIDKFFLILTFNSF